jgi:hypothetical protein
LIEHWWYTVIWTLPSIEAAHHGRIRLHLGIDQAGVEFGYRKLLSHRWIQLLLLLLLLLVVLLLVLLLLL